MVILNFIVTSMPISIRALLKPYSLTLVVKLLLTVPIKENLMGILGDKLTSKELFNKEPKGISHTMPFFKYVNLVPSKESDNTKSLLSPFY